MYEFSIVDINHIDINDFNNFKNKVPFTTVEWLNYLQKLKNIKPIILSISYEGKKVGYFTGGIVHFIGIKLLGSPFWGWMGQHMGFDLREEVNKSVLIDDLIDYANYEMKCGYVQLTDLKFGYDDIKACSHKLIPGERYKTCYLDLTKTEEELFKNFSRVYRQHVRKFEKEGGMITEDYSDAFINEHHKQLKQVFTKKSIKAPNYKKKLYMIYNSDCFVCGEKAEDGLGVLSISASIPVNGEMRIIGSSYFIYNRSMAMYFSNASYTEYLLARPNQALTWYAMRKFKRLGIQTLDMGGSGDYKLNFGADWDPKPIIIWSRNKWNYMLILGLKRDYGKFIRAFGKVRTKALNSLHKLQRKNGEPQN